MNKVILPIKPEFVQKIISGEKKYEFRKKIFKKDVDIVLIYCCSPISKIIGEFKIKNILHDTLENIWEKTQIYSGIDKKDLAKYLGQFKFLYAIEIENLIIYEKPICVIKDLLKSVPQSFIYCDEF